eukprot:g19275.t1
MFSHGSYGRNVSAAAEGAWPRQRAHLVLQALEQQLLQDCVEDEECSADPADSSKRKQTSSLNLRRESELQTETSSANVGPDAADSKQGQDSAGSPQRSRRDTTRASDKLERLQVGDALRAVRAAELLLEQTLQQCHDQTQLQVGWSGRQLLQPFALQTMLPPSWCISHCVARDWRRMLTLVLLVAGLVFCYKRLELPPLDYLAGVGCILLFFPLLAQLNRRVALAALREFDFYYVMLHIITEFTLIVLYSPRKTTWSRLTFMVGVFVLNVVVFLSDAGLKWSHRARRAFWSAMAALWVYTWYSNKFELEDAYTEELCLHTPFSRGCTSVADLLVLASAVPAFFCLRFALGSWIYPEKLVVVTAPLAFHSKDAISSLCPCKLPCTNRFRHRKTLPNPPTRRRVTPPGSTSRLTSSDDIFGSSVGLDLKSVGKWPQYATSPPGSSFNLYRASAFKLRGNTSPNRSIMSVASAISSAKSPTISPPQPAARTMPRPTAAENQLSSSQHDSLPSSQHDSQDEGSPSKKPLKIPLLSPDRSQDSRSGRSSPEKVSRSGRSSPEQGSSLLPRLRIHESRATSESSSSNTSLTSEPVLTKALSEGAVKQHQIVVPFVVRALSAQQSALLPTDSSSSSSDQAHPAESELLPQPSLQE